MTMKYMFEKNLIIKKIVNERNITMNTEMMILPTNCSLIENEEMEYIDGGEYISKRVTLSYAKNWVGAVVATHFGTGAISALASLISPVFLATDAIIGYSIWNALDVYNDVCKWESQYGGDRKCILGANFEAKIVTGIDCELA